MQHFYHYALIRICGSRFAWMLVLLAISLSAVPVQADKREFAHPRLGYEGIGRSDAMVMSRADIPQKIGSTPLRQSRIVYEAAGDGFSGYQIFRMDDGGLVRLTGSNGDKTQARLSSDSQWVVYAAETEGSYQLWIMDANGANQRRLTYTPGDVFYPDWSPDSSRIVYQSNRNGQWDLYVINADGSGDTQLTNDPDYDGMAAWSPDGQRIAFVSRRSGGYRVYSMSQDGSDIQLISYDPYSARPTWSPDGLQILYDADVDQDGWQELRVVNVDASAAMTLMDIASSAGSGTDYLSNTWSPDGSYIAFNALGYEYQQNQWFLTSASLQSESLVFAGQRQTLAYSPSFFVDWGGLGPAAPDIHIEPVPAISPAPLKFFWSPGGKRPEDIEAYYIRVCWQENGQERCSDEIAQQTTPSFTIQQASLYRSYYLAISARNSANWYSPWRRTGASALETQKPIIDLYPAPPYWPRWQALAVKYRAYDPGGSAIYSLSTGNGTILPPNYVITLTPPWYSIDNELLLQLQAIDATGMRSEWSHLLRTRLYNSQVDGRVTDVRGTPITGAQLTFSKAPIYHSQPGLTGVYQAFFDETEMLSLNVTATGFSDLPPATFTLLGPTNASLQPTKAQVVPELKVNYLAVLPPLDNFITNGGFENSLTNNWLVSGALTTAPTQEGHSGKALFIQRGGPAVQSANVLEDINFSTKHIQNYEFAADDQGGLTVLWRHNPDPDKAGPYTVYTRHMPANGTWSETQTLLQDTAFQFTAGRFMKLMPDGSAHLIFPQQKLVHLKRTAAGNWEEAETIGSGLFYDFYDYEVTNEGVIYLVGNTLKKPFMFVRSLANGWSQPEPLLETGNLRDLPLLWLTPDQQLHVLLQNDSGITYHRYIPDQGWEDGISLALDGSRIVLSEAHVRVTDSGNVHLLLLSKLTNTENGLTRDVYHLAGERDEHGGYLWQSANLIVDDAVIWKNEENYDLDIDSTPAGDLHIIYSGQEGGVTYRRYRADTAAWMQPHNVSSSDPYNLSLAVAPDGKVYFGHRAPIGVIVIFLYGGSPTLVARLDNDVSTRMELLFDPNGNLHSFWVDGSGIHSQAILMPPKLGTSTLTQSLTLPISMTNPTLSFFYKIEGNFGTSSQEEFRVKLGTTNQSPASLRLNYPNGIGLGWNHAWADLSAWAGQAVTVTFQMTSSASQPLSFKLDEVSLGSAFPDLALGAYPRQVAILPGQVFAIEIQPANPGSLAVGEAWIEMSLPAGIAYVGASQTPQVDGQVLRWNLGNMDKAVKPIQLWLRSSPIALVNSRTSLQLNLISDETETSRSNNQIEIPVLIQSRIYLPLAGR